MLKMYSVFDMWRQRCAKTFNYGISPTLKNLWNKAEKCVKLFVKRMIDLIVLFEVYLLLFYV